MTFPSHSDLVVFIMDPNAHNFSDISSSKTFLIVSQPYWPLSWNKPGTFCFRDFFSQMFSQLTASLCSNQFKPSFFSRRHITIQYLMGLRIFCMPSPLGCNFWKENEYSFMVLSLALNSTWHIVGLLYIRLKEYKYTFSITLCTYVCGVHTCI